MAIENGEVPKEISLREVQKLKRALQSGVLKLVHEFENRTDLQIRNINLTHVRTVGDPAYCAAVDLEISL